MIIDSDVDRLARAITTLFHPHVEAVLHDVNSGRIAALWNPTSQRKVGDASLIEPGWGGDDSSGEIVGPYQQVDIRGHQTTSVSVPLLSGHHVLCLNFDRSALEGVAQLLQAFAAPRVDQPDALFSGDWRAKVNASIAQWCAAQGTLPRHLTKAQRRDLVSHLAREGIFETRHASQHVASALGVSRATVYNLRKELTP